MISESSVFRSHCASASFAAEHGCLQLQHHQIVRAVFHRDIYEGCFQAVVEPLLPPIDGNCGEPMTIDRFSCLAPRLEFVHEIIAYESSKLTRSQVSLAA